MTELAKFLETGESISSVIEYPGFDINIVERQGLASGDEVLLDIRTATEPCVLVGGNHLRIEVASGYGRLAMTDLEAGIQTNIFLEPDLVTDIPPHNYLYWYENHGEKTLVVRDHCDDFADSNEPTLESVVKALGLF